MATMSKLTIAEALGVLRTDRQSYMRLLERSDFDVGMYKPERVDNQTLHTRDEVYVIAAGTGEFVCQGEKTTFGQGDVLYAPAGVEHQFLNFSDDFTTWVIFIGAR